MYIYIYIYIYYVYTIFIYVVYGKIFFFYGILCYTGVKLCDVYNAVYSNISKNKPDLKDKFVKNIG